MGGMALRRSISTPPDNCANSTAVSSGYGLPKDCNQGSANVGSGVWNAAKYFNTNHNGINPATFAPPAPSNQEFAGSGWAAYGPTGLGTTPFLTAAMLRCGAHGPALPMPGYRA